MSIDQSAQDLLSGGSPVAKFPDIGTIVKGTVVAAVAQQARDMDSGKPKVWDDGNPVMQLVITLQTDLRDPAIDSDDGLRRLFAGGKMLTAIRVAVQRSGGRLDAGGKLAVKYTGDGDATRKGFNPPKLYSAEYQPAAIQTGGLLDGPTPDSIL